MLNISRFYKLTRSQRIDSLVEQGFIIPDSANLLSANPQLSELIANNLIENQLSQFSLPLGVGLNFVVNEKELLVPMVTEEPSVIAACSYGAKLAKKLGGFKVTTSQRKVIGQIILDNVKAFQATSQLLQAKIPELIALANQALPSLTQRGGGVESITVKIVQDQKGTDQFICLYLSVDTQAAMGANLVNTILEICAKQLQAWFNVSVLMSILSNYATECLISANCQIDPEDLKNKGYTGLEVAQKIVRATEYANLDIYRTTTHNKGIMNGVDAVVIATGNDFRAVEAGAHAYASRNGTYQSLSSWQLNANGYLEGNLTLPLNVGIVGGATNVLPLVKVALEMAKVTTVQDLGAMIVAVGLAQNLAALKALVTTGIQKGHMALHARSLAITIGAKENEITRLVTLLRQQTTINTTVAKELLSQIRNSK